MFFFLDELDKAQLQQSDSVVQIVSLEGESTTFLFLNVMDFLHLFSVKIKFCGVSRLANAAGDLLLHLDWLDGDATAFAGFYQLPKSITGEMSRNIYQIFVPKG
jgi:hypothetical protein